MTHPIQILLLGLALGGVYALMASGLTLIFGVMGIVNLAHAAFMIVGAPIVCFLAFKRYGLDPILSIAIVMPLMFCVLASCSTSCSSRARSAMRADTRR